MKIPEEIAEAIDFPLERWQGNCFAVAQALVDNGVFEGRAVYGHYLGPVARGGFFKTTRLFQRHGWVILDYDGRILDPTRWVFENAEPYIYLTLGNDAEYDEGGNRWRDDNEPSLPQWSEDDRRIDLELGIEAEEIVVGALTGGPPWLTYPLLMWLANLSLDRLQPHAKEIYDALATAGQKAMVPWDNWEATHLRR